MFRAKAPGDEPVPPEPYRFVTDADAASKQQILDLAQRPWIAERISLLRKLRAEPVGLNQICFNNAV
jgi:hypothetical protein